MKDKEVATGNSEELTAYHVSMYLLDKQIQAAADTIGLTRAELLTALIMNNGSNNPLVNDETGGDEDATATNEP